MGQAIVFPHPAAYAPMDRLQSCLHLARRENRIGDTVLFLEHRPVVTLGRRRRDEHLLMSREALAARGIDVHVSSRGGDVTFHGPGQWVMYPILRLGEEEADARGYLANLEEIALKTAGAHGVAAYRREGMSGAWTDHGKIAAIGFHIRRWITLHGMSFNVNDDLRGFDYIVGCGLVGEKVSSLHAILGAAAPDMNQVLDTMIGVFGEVCGRRLETRSWAEARTGLVEAGVELPQDNELFF